MARFVKSPDAKKQSQHQVDIYLVVCQGKISGSEGYPRFNGDFSWLENLFAVSWSSHFSLNQLPFIGKSPHGETTQNASIKLPMVGGDPVGSLK